MDVARLRKERKASDGNDAGWKAAAATDVLSTDPDYLDGNYMVCVWEGKSFGLSPTLYKHPCANIPVKNIPVKNVPVKNFPVKNILSLWKTSLYKGQI